MPKLRSESIPTERQSARRLKAAVELLASLPGFSDVRCRLYDEAEPILEGLWKLPLPRTQAFELFDMNSRLYAELIRDAASREAYLTVLNEVWFPSARALLFGHPKAEPLRDDGMTLSAKLDNKLRYWQNTAYSRTRATEGSQPRTATNLEDATCSGSRHPGEPRADGEVSRRQNLLGDYKSTTGILSDKKIYEARNSGIYKPEFYKWRDGRLSRASKTTQNFERFLREQKAPIPRKPSD